MRRSGRVSDADCFVDEAADIGSRHNVRLVRTGDIFPEFQRLQLLAPNRTLSQRLLMTSVATKRASAWRHIGSLIRPRGPLSMNYIQPGDGYGVDLPPTQDVQARCSPRQINQTEAEIEQIP
jgi:hypothetical protein